MKSHIIFITALIFTVNSADAVRCIQCSQTHFTGDPDFDDCYKLESVDVRENTNCFMADSDAYCFTKIELSDGMLSYLERGCTNPREDALYASDKAPDSMKCTTSYGNMKNSQSIHQTQCYSSCKGDVCNTMKMLDQFKPCPSSCPGNTECNYLTGKCQCGPNRYGDECKSNSHLIASRSCVQCNSRTHPNCANMTVGTTCQNGERHCSTTQTWILNHDGSIDGRPTITRSCTSQYVSPDRCYLTDTSDISSAKYTEYTCVSTCSTENCNTGEANGIVDEEFIPMKCVICEGDEVSCGPSKTLATDCPRNTTHCSSTVTYWETVVEDTKLTGFSRPEPSVSIRFIKRGCANVPVKANCVRKRVGVLNMNEVSCTETCSGDGCNTGWPARPRCVKCDNKAHDINGEACLTKPPPSQDCQGPHHEYCFARIQSKRAISTSKDISQAANDGFEIVRGCSSYNENRSNPCRNITEFGRVIGMECMDYCESNGCNYKNFITENTDMPKLGEVNGTWERHKHSIWNVCLMLVLSCISTGR